MKLKALSTVVMVAALFTQPVHAAVEIQWWHSMEGALGDRVNEMARQFNASQTEFKVVPVYKGNYAESMAAGIAAFRGGNAPDILQVFEVGTATMMAAKGVIKPVEELMKQNGEKFDRNSFLPAVAGYYAANNGELLSFPFNSSTTVMFYNKDAFAKAGLDANKPPATWQDMVGAMAKLKASGSKCPYTTAWQAWVQLESFSTLHNVPYATENNGFGGTGARLVFNDALRTRHIDNMAKWAQQGYYSYSGRKDEGNARFFSGECAMITGSSAAYGNIKKNATFHWGVAALPYYSDVPGAPKNTIIGGASLWVMSGKSKEEYKGVAKFLSFLSQPALQADWHQGTGYLPITTAAYELTKKSGFYDKNPGTDIAVKQMLVKTTVKSRGVRLGNMLQIRDVVDQELENVWSGKKSAKQALDDAASRGNELLERFQKANKS
ncbi:MAG: sn-glycerol-3-phosphate ABC transporter substrate-binding protein UgpB [Burkholderiales bacterium]|nr:sn-glycerol-3-phosphate ABC transporter substrate-binding protein UgpB [Burkholderiales bacterium]MDE1926292.1 sn-glycerol-3-phosphate ABC transporter substrate-binding protein UgpB [Burkholderiales bacterium]MDE2158196.1 sn-glycerol-3-phosphate ABC transporter substrate-binding protein UgpB [Burkholderiales bacterium]